MNSHKASATRWLWFAAGLGFAGYAALGWRAGHGEGTGTKWLLAAQAAGWGALALAWRAIGMVDTDAAAKARTRLVLAAALAFRLCGLGVAPGWEDDYLRHLWDGWLTWRTGSPYGVAPLDWFADDAVPARMQAVLDGINHPERATIYGPVAQAWGATAAALDAGKLWVFKAGLVAAEAAAWRAAWRLGGVRAFLLLAWCPLAVTEIAFAGHVDALALAAVMVALGCGARGRWAAACGWAAAAVATKGYALMLAPFFVWRGGWRGAAVFAATLGLVYAPWMAATVAAGRPAMAVFGGDGVGAMAGTFEFNSTGYAALAWALGDGVARVAAGGLMLAGWAGLAWAWRRQGDCAPIPGAAVVGWWALWSPVFHPWYALLALPFWALHPTGWMTGLLAAVPLSYLHGLGFGTGVGDFRHPAWVRPVELAGVATGAVAAWWRKRRVV